MKVKLEKVGAPKLPTGFRYRVHVHEVYENRVDLGISIIKKKTKTVPVLGKVIPWLGDEVVVSSILRLPQDSALWESPSPILDRANLLYKLAFTDKE